MPLGVSKGKLLNAQLTREEQHDHKADTILMSGVLKLNSHRNKQPRWVPSIRSRRLGWASARNGAYREFQRRNVNPSGASDRAAFTCALRAHKGSPRLPPSGRGVRGRAAGSGSGLASGRLLWDHRRHPSFNKE
ncbi:hypothetical protein MC885_008328 [Smutsia gigantea]|nr:hypothetical protein MC885_008328 [Smutsia gigantea]